MFICLLRRCLSFDCFFICGGRKGGGGGVVGSYFGHCFTMCPGSLHLKQFGWSVVANIRCWVSSYDTIKDGGILSTSSGFTYICRLKLNM